MKPAPEKIDKAHVICFASIDSRVQSTGNCKHTVGGVRQSPASGLAICQYENAGGFYLFSCDSQWNCITDTYHETLEEAKQQAEFEYAGVSKVRQATRPQMFNM